MIQEPIFDFANISSQSKSTRQSHYYGDTTRKLFLTAAFLMLFFTPFFVNYLPVPLFFGLLFVLLLSLFSGLTSPRMFWVALTDMGISFVAVFIFGYFATSAFLEYNAYHPYFWVNQILGSLFLMGLYFSIKTVRGFLNKKTE